MNNIVMKLTSRIVMSHFFSSDPMKGYRHGDDTGGMGSNFSHIDLTKQVVF